MRGVAAGTWFWDVSAQYGHDEIDFNITDSLNTSLGPNIPPNQTEFYAGSLENSQFVANLDVTRELEIGMAGPLNFAIGAEFRNENYQQHAGEEASWIAGPFPDRFGAVAPAPAPRSFRVFVPSNEVDASRRSYAGYVDFEGDVLSFLRLGLAGRFEHYSDFGNTSDYKLTARLEATKQLVFRGAISTGFRAPSLGQTNFSAISTNFLNVNGVFVPFEVGHFRVNSDLARALGAEDLEPEDSVNYSAGFVWSPSRAFDFTADYFFIGIDNRVILSGNFAGPLVAPILQPFNATGARFFTNAIDTETEGFELTANTQASLGSAGSLPLPGGLRALGKRDHADRRHAAAAHRIAGDSLRPYRGAAPDVRTAGRQPAADGGLEPGRRRSDRSREPVRRVLQHRQPQPGGRPDVRSRVAARPRGPVSARPGQAGRGGREPLRHLPGQEHPGQRQLGNLHVPAQRALRIQRALRLPRGPRIVF